MFPARFVCEISHHWQLFFLNPVCPSKTLKSTSVVLHTWRAKRNREKDVTLRCVQRILLWTLVFLAAHWRPLGGEDNAPLCSCKSRDSYAWWSEPDLNGFISWGQNINPGEPGKKMKNHIFYCLGPLFTFIILEKTLFGQSFQTICMFFCLRRWSSASPKNSLVFTCGFLWSSNPWEDWGRVLLFLSVSRVRCKSTLTWPPKNHFGARQSSPLVVHEAISVWRSIISNAWFSLFSIFFGIF